jgi:hypothetical protein
VGITDSMMSDSPGVVSIKIEFLFVSRRRQKEESGTGGGRQKEESGTGEEVTGG